MVPVQMVTKSAIATIFIAARIAIEPSIKTVMHTRTFFGMERSRWGCGKDMLTTI